MPHTTPVSTTAPAACYHCGLPLPAPRLASAGSDQSPRGDAGQTAADSLIVRIDDIDHAMCCPGCAAVAQTIVDLGQQSYYRDRTAYAASAEGAQQLPPELQLYDNADPRFALDADSRESTFTVEGLRCAACVWLIEQRRPSTVKVDSRLSASSAKRGSALSYSCSSGGSCCAPSALAA